MHQIVGERDFHLMENKLFKGNFCVLFKKSELNDL